MTTPNPSIAVQQPRERRVAGAERRRQAPLCPTCQAARTGDHRSPPKTGAPPRPRTSLTVAEFCAELGISRSTFYDWRTKGRAPVCIKLPNGELRIRHAEFERWLQSCEE